MEEVNWQIFQAAAQMVAAQTAAGQSVAARAGATDTVIKREFVNTYRALEQAARDIQQGNLDRAG